MAGGLGRKNKVNTPATDRPPNTSISRNNSIMAGGLGRKNIVNTPATESIMAGTRQGEEKQHPSNRKTTSISTNNSIMAGSRGAGRRETTPQQQKDY
jgi:hypothetical protein